MFRVMVDTGIAMPDSKLLAVAGAAHMRHFRMITDMDGINVVFRPLNDKAIEAGEMFPFMAAASPIVKPFLTRYDYARFDELLRTVMGKFDTMYMPDAEVLMTDKEKQAKITIETQRVLNVDFFALANGLVRPQ